MEKTTIVAIIQEAGLPEANAKILADYFLPFEKQANEWKEIAEKIVVTDVSQKSEMKQADEARKALVKVRTGIARVHQELKANALKEGRLYDKIKNTLTDFVTPIEEHLAAQANFEKIQIENERKRIQSKRVLVLSAYMDNAESMPLADMNQDAFDNLLAGQKLAHEARIEAEKKAEQDMIDAQKKEAEEREAQRLENLRLKELNDAKEKELAAERAKADAERKALEAKNKAAQEESNRLAAELKAKKDKEEAEEKERLADEKKAQRAPDKQKLLTIVEKIELLQFEITSIDFKDADAKKVFEGVVTLLEKIRVYVNENSSKL